MIERRGVNGGLLLWVERLHQIHFDFEGTAANDANVFVDVFTLALEGAGDL